MGINQVGEVLTATIASGAAVSGALFVGGRRVVGVAMPAAWTAAGLSFQASADGSTYYDVYDDSGNEVTATAAAQRFIVFDSTENLAGVLWLKVRSGTTGTPVNQAAGREVGVVVR